ncbi:MAG: adenylate/guanylate cyclase domain-containing protein [Solirubrobacterales bacterium]
MTRYDELIRGGYQAMNRLPNWVQRLVSIGRVPADSEETRLRKSVLVLSALLMTCLSSIWVVTYALLGLWESAAIPFVYQLASAASILAFTRTQRFIVFRRSQLLMSLIFPFVLQWSLGGFENGSVVCLWGITSPLGALMFVGARQSVPWFAGFVGLVGLSTALDSSLAASAPEIPQATLIVFFALNLLGVATTAYALLQYFVRARERVAAELARQHLALEVEQEKSERLLLNVLPEPVANRLKESEEIIADEFSEVTVLFADLVGFTQLAERMPADELVALLNRIFARWDVLAAERGVEKIKTIGDAYMAAAGVPVRRDDHAEAVASLALAMQPEVESCSEVLEHELRLRIGIDSGPVVAGVIGRSKFIYDLWGDTVNTASRMESHSLPGAIQVTERARDRLTGRFDLRHRGMIEIKGKGRMASYLLVGEK